MNDVEKAILYTLAYSDIFHFPLTKKELWQFLISDKKIAREEFDRTLKNLSKEIVVKNGYYALAAHEADSKIRKKNLPELKKKLQIANRAAFYLSYLPTIKLIGLSGSVAVGKAEPDDDIDFFIITKKKKLYITRVLIQAVLEMLNLRRKRLEKVAKDKVCVNLLIDEAQLAWPEETRDVYTAHEILQLKPLFDRNQTYKKFTQENIWVQEFFPNAFEEEPEIIGKVWKRNYVGVWLATIIFTSRIFEKCAAVLQKNHMKKVQTTEVISSTWLAFHPVDYRSKTLKNFHVKLRELGLLTNK